MVNARRWLRPALRYALRLFASSVLTSACQYVSGLEDLQVIRAVTGDAAVETGASATSWGCLNQPKQTAPTGTVEYRNSILRLSDLAPVTDAEVRLCGKRDEPCTEPLQTLRPIDGNLVFTIDGAFDGYIEISSAQLMPAVIELARPLGSMRTLPQLLLLDGPTLNRFTEAMKATIDPTQGHALFWAEDCLGRRAKGVSVKALDALAPNSAQYYVTNSLPSVSVDRTEAPGGGGFINIPTGFRTFQAFLAEDERPVAPPHTARVREGTVTYFVFEPN